MENEVSEVMVLGQKLETLGKAMQDIDVDLKHLSELALNCGLILRVGLFEDNESTD